MNLNETLYVWCEREFPKHTEKVYADLLDVAAGNREGNTFEQEAVQRIFAEYYGETEEVTVR